MLSSYNCGKYLTRTYERDKNADELDKTGLTADELSFLEIEDGEGAMKARLEKLREQTDGVLYDL